jgi:RecB family exonuclease
MYFDWLEKNPPKPIFLEKGFTLKCGGVVLKGRIDRIDAIEGGVEIIDYKTGKPKTEKELALEDKQQLMIYQLAAAQSFSPPIVPRKLTFHYLEDHSTVSFLATDEELETLKEHVQSTVAEIHVSIFPPKPSPLCHFCDFRDICEFRQL